VLVDELLELGHVCLCFLDRRGIIGNWMTRHGNGKGMTCGVLTFFKDEKNDNILEEEKRTTPGKME